MLGIEFLAGPLVAHRLPPKTTTTTKVARNLCRGPLKVLGTRGSASSHVAQARPCCVFNPRPSPGDPPARSTCKDDVRRCKGQQVRARRSGGPGFWVTGLICEAGRLEGLPVRLQGWHECETIYKDTYPWLSLGPVRVRMSPPTETGEEAQLPQTHRTQSKAGGQGGSRHRP